MSDSSNHLEISQIQLQPLSTNLNSPSNTHRFLCQQVNQNISLLSSSILDTFMTVVLILNLCCFVLLNLDNSDQLKWRVHANWLVGFGLLAVGALLLIKVKKSSLRDISLCLVVQFSMKPLLGGLNTIHSSTLASTL